MTLNALIVFIKAFLLILLIRLTVNQLLCTLFFNQTSHMKNRISYTHSVVILAVQGA